MAQEHTIARDIVNRLPVGGTILRILAPRGEDPMTGTALSQAVEAKRQRSPYSAMYGLKNYSPQLVCDVTDEKGKPQDRFIATPIGIKVGNVLIALAAEKNPRGPKAGTVDAANERATEAQSRLALAVAEVRKWRDTNDAVEAAHDAGVKHNNKGEEYEAKNDLAYACLIAAHHARAATDADPVLAKMIGGGE